MKIICFDFQNYHWSVMPGLLWKSTLNESSIYLSTFPPQWSPWHNACLPLPFILGLARISYTVCLTLMFRHMPDKSSDALLFLQQACYCSCIYQRSQTLLPIFCPRDDTQLPAAAGQRNLTCFGSIKLFSFQYTDILFLYLKLKLV